MTGFPACVEWNGLTDPETHGTSSVVANAKAMRHILEKHVLNPAEPWRDWLGGDVLGRLMAAGTEAATAADLACLADAIRGEVERALAAPLLLSCVKRRTEGPVPGGWHRRWLLILPGGAQAVLSRNRKGGMLLTCFFSRAAAARNRSSRWRAAAHHVVEKYVRFVPGVGFVPPAGDEVVHNRKNISFVSPSNWGFRNRLTREVWMTLSRTWPGDASTTRGAPTRRTRLRPAAHDRRMQGST
jgi:hypothetical protein